MSDLASVIVGNPDDISRIPQWREGVVTATNPLMVRVGAATTSMACRALSSYVPNVGDGVSVLVISGDRLVLGLASQSGGQNIAPLNLGANNYGGSYKGLNWGGNYLIMSDGTNTFVSAPGAGFVSIRGGINSAYKLDINADGNHVMVGHLDMGVYNINNVNNVTSSQFTTGGIFYISNGGGGWHMQDGTWVRSYNNKNIYTGGEIRAGAKFSHDGTGYTFTHSTDTDTGLYYHGDGLLSVMANGQWPTIFTPTRFTVRGIGGYRLNLKEYNDDYHSIFYYSGIEGVQIQGNSTVRIFLSGEAGYYWDFYADGWARAVNGHGWTTGSSITIKENVEDLPIERAIEMIRGLRPVTYDRIDGTRTDEIGFIAEWTEPVVPQAVAVGDDMSTAGIDYGKFTPITTRVLQDVLDRLDALEAT